MRSLLALAIYALPLTAVAQADARIDFLSKQLATAGDARVRAQTAVILAATKDARAVPPLCGALKDAEAIVRSAAARSLGDLRQPSAKDCLEAAKNDRDADVKSAVQKALEALKSGPLPAMGALYVAIDPIADKGGGFGPDVLKLAEDLLREKLGKMGAGFAPAGEPKPAAAALIKQRKLKGFLLKVSLSPGSGPKSLKVDMLVLTYPDQAMQGTWNVKAAGAQPPALLKLMIPKVVDDAAADLDWSQTK